MGWTVRTDGSAEGSWVVTILDPEGVERLTQRYPSEDEASTFASTVRQHLGWLSEERFRAYYRL
jgi:hypothetical protein